MTWVQAHPPGTTSVASTKTQFQQNNLYIETTLQVDHYFDDATATNDGHHKFVQMPLQGGDPGVAITGGGCTFVKDSLTNSEPSLYYQNGTNTMIVPMGIDCGTFLCTSGTTNTFDFAPYPKMKGWIYAYDTSYFRRSIASPFVWDGTAFFPNGSAGQLITGSQLEKFETSGSGLVAIKTTTNITVDISVIGIFT